MAGTSPAMTEALELSRALPRLDCGITATVHLIAVAIFGPFGPSAARMTNVAACRHAGDGLLPSSEVK
jgi:hypothetical protein